MSPVLGVLESTRVYLLAFTLAPALLWFGFGAGGGAGDASLGAAGMLLVIAHSLLVLFHVTSFDAATLAAGGTPRLGLTGNKAHWDAELVDRSRMVYAATTGVVAVVLFVAMFFSDVWKGSFLVVLVALGIIGWATGGVSGGSRRWRLLFAEVMWPGVMLAGPMVLASWMVLGPDRGTGLPAAGTGLMALLLAGYVIVCEMRDAEVDFGEGQRTLVTVLGVGGAAAVFFVLVCVVVMSACRGVGLGWWHWSVGGVVGVASAVAMWSMGSKSEEPAVGLWVVGSGIVGVVMVWG